MSVMRGIEFNRLVGVGCGPPLQGEDCCFGMVAQGFTLGYHMAGFQPCVRIETMDILSGPGSRCYI